MTDKWVIMEARMMDDIPFITSVPNPEGEDTIHGPWRWVSLKRAELFDSEEEAENAMLNYIKFNEQWSGTDFVILPLKKAKEKFTVTLMIAQAVSDGKFRFRANEDGEDGD